MLVITWRDRNPFGSTVRRIRHLQTASFHDHTRPTVLVRRAVNEYRIYRQNTVRSKYRSLLVRSTKTFDENRKKLPHNVFTLVALVCEEYFSRNWIKHDQSEHCDGVCNMEFIAVNARVIIPHLSILFNKTLRNTVGVFLFVCSFLFFSFLCVSFTSFCFDHYNINKDDYINF